MSERDYLISKSIKEVDKAFKMPKLGSLKRLGKPKPSGRLLGPGQPFHSVNNTNGKATKWAVGKPGDWV
jgi:hypothetical protein